MISSAIDIVRRDACRLDVAEAGEVLTLQYAAWLLEAIENATLAIPTLHETLDDIRGQLIDRALTIWGLRLDGRLVGTVRTSILADGSGYIGRLGVVPDRHGQGLGSALLRFAEGTLSETVTRFELMTGARSVSNHRFYARHGYKIFDRNDAEGYVRMRRVVGNGA